MDFTFPAPAKVNRFLHITGQREDGYHLLQTLFHLLDYGDEIRVERRHDNQIQLFPQTQWGIAQEENIIYKAAKKLQQASLTPYGANIFWQKRIPLGSGLGGGSSNAASCLFALNLLWELNWSREQLMTLGLTLGADVPVFLFGHTALAEGIGEKCVAIDMPPTWLLVLTPPCHVATAKMYAMSELTRNTPRLRIEALAKGGMEQALQRCRNDFEVVVRKAYPEVDAALKWLSNYGEARLSGSGASVFTCFTSQEQAQSAAEQLPPTLKGFIAKGMNTSPLLQKAMSMGFQGNDWGVAKR